MSAQQKKTKLYELLYEWFVSETCDCCQHIKTFRDDDQRHPCNKCDCYERFRISDEDKEDLKEKVNQILGIVKEKEEVVCQKE